jgi:hypothetical protein
MAVLKVLVALILRQCAKGGNLRERENEMMVEEVKREVII